MTKIMTEQTPVRIERIFEKKQRFKRPSFFVQLAVLIVFLLIPFVFPSFKTVDLSIKIVIFATLVASFDILLGYTGILSFGHVMFFGIGAYSHGMFLEKYGESSYLNFMLAFLAAIVITIILALLISFLSLRVKAIFFAMITLAIAEFAIILSTKLSGFTGGEDGISMEMPGIFSVNFEVTEIGDVFIDGKFITYYVILLVCVGLFLLMRRFINSPLGRVLQAIRDNQPRAEALGYKTFLFQTISICFGCVIAAIVGGLYAMWVEYVNPESVLGIPIMLDVLLMVIIGGMGTLYGGIVGAAFLKIAHTFLPDLQNFTQKLFPNAHLLHNAMERWLLIFGILFILVVFFFPKGIMGTIREFADRRRKTSVAA